MKNISLPPRLRNPAQGKGGAHMALVTAVKILTPRPRGWAVGAFNVHNLEDTQAVVRAAEKLRAPVIIQVSETR